MKKIDCNIPPKNHDLPRQWHDPLSLVGLLSMEDIDIVDFRSTKNRIPVNSNVLDFILEYPEHIPTYWDISEGIVFTGTSHYDEENGELTYRGLGYKQGEKKNGICWFTVHKVKFSRDLAFSHNTRYKFAVLKK